MSREDFLQICHDVRFIPSDAAFDILTTKVVVRTRTWSGDRLGVGTATDVDVEILPRPRVEEDGDQGIVIKLIQPRSALGGYTPQDLLIPNPQSMTVERFWVLTGPDGVEREYVPDKLITDKALHYSVSLRCLDRRVPQ